MKPSEPTFATAKPGELYRAPDGCLKRKPVPVAPVPAVTPAQPVARPQAPRPGIPKAGSLKRPLRGQQAPKPGLLFRLTAALCEQYPAFAQNLPLKIGVLKDLVDGGLNRSTAVKFLMHWTGRREYHAAVAAGATRFNLDGTPAGPLTEKHKAYAAEQLKD